ncbi:Wzt carbohydrate-binding domain-containing protein [Chlamydiota bacterium]
MICVKLFSGKNDLFVGDPISVRLEYDAKREIESPVFSLDIYRYDGVHCCSCNTKDDNVSIERIKGKGALKIDVMEMKLTLGIYFTKICAWDRDIIHPYTLEQHTIFRIKEEKIKSNINPLMFPRVQWNVM